MTLYLEFEKHNIAEVFMMNLLAQHYREVEGEILQILQIIVDFSVGNNSFKNRNFFA